jgi:hypothetical protein
LPAPAIWPAVVPAEVMAEMSTVPPALVMKRALPPLLEFRKDTLPVRALIVADPALLESLKITCAPVLSVKVAVPALEVLKNSI